MRLRLHLHCRAWAATLQQPPCSPPAVAATPPCAQQPGLPEVKAACNSEHYGSPLGTQRHSPGNSSAQPGPGPCRAARYSPEQDTGQQRLCWGPPSPSPTSSSWRLAAGGPRTVKPPGLATREASGPQVGSRAL